MPRLSIDYGALSIPHPDEAFSPLFIPSRGIYKPEDLQFVAVGRSVVMFELECEASERSALLRATAIPDIGLATSQRQRIFAVSANPTGFIRLDPWRGVAYYNSVPTTRSGEEIQRIESLKT